MEHYHVDKFSNSIQVEDYMDKLLVPLRTAIFDRKKDSLETILTWWPYLGEYNHFVRYSCYLLGKNVSVVWNKNLTEKAPMVIRLIACCKQVKKSTSDAQKIKFQAMRNTIDEAQDSSKNLNSDLPKTLAIFPLICLSDP